MTNRHQAPLDYEAFFRKLAALTSTERLGSCAPRSPAERAATRFHAHPGAMRLRRVQRIGFALPAAVGQPPGAIPTASARRFAGRSWARST